MRLGGAALAMGRSCLTPPQVRAWLAGVLRDRVVCWGRRCMQGSLPYVGLGSAARWYVAVRWPVVFIPGYACHAVSFMSCIKMYACCLVHVPVRAHACPPAYLPACRPACA